MSVTKIATKISHRMFSSVCVSAAQFCPTLCAPFENVKKMSSLVKYAVQVPATMHIVVFPELALTGYSLTPDDIQGLAQKFDVGRGMVGPYIRLMAKVARTNNCYVAFGFPGVKRVVVDGSYQDKYHNAAALIGPTGSIFTYAVKRSLWGPDWLWAEAATEPQKPVVTLPNGLRVGMLICRDLNNTDPVTEEPYIKTGDADLVLGLTSWGKGEWPSSSWIDFVRDTSSWLAISNRYGEEPYAEFQGGPCIVSPKGKVHFKGMVPNTDCIVSTMLEGTC